MHELEIYSSLSSPSFGRGALRSRASSIAPSWTVVTHRFLSHKTRRHPRKHLDSSLAMRDFALGRRAFDEYIEALGLQPEELDSSSVNRDNSGKKAELRSWAWSSKQIQWARLTVIRTGAGFRVANWAAFPRPDLDAPMCQAELIEVKGKLFLLVLDALYAGSSGRGPATTDLSEWKLALQHLTQVKQRPSWSEGFITPEAIWSRTGTTEALEEGFSVFHQFMRGSIRWLSGPSDGRSADRSDLYRAMRSRFLDNEPSRPFMTKVFGSHWSEAYMQSFLFPRRTRPTSDH